MDAACPATTAICVVEYASRPARNEESKDAIVSDGRTLYQADDNSRETIIQRLNNDVVHDHDYLHHSNLFTFYTKINKNNKNSNATIIVNSVARPLLPISIAPREPCSS